MARSKSNPSIQAIRYAAALLVVLDHGIATYSEKIHATNLVSTGWRLGEIGVSIFFAISGFIMLLSHFDDFGAQGSVPRFAWKRITRIYPLYWIASLIYAAKTLLSGGLVTVATLALSLLLIPYPGANGAVEKPVYGLGWTLQYEMFFYAVFAFSLLFKRTLGIAICVVTFLIGVASIGLYGDHAWPVVDYLFRPIVLFFVSGMFVFLGWRWLSRRRGEGGFTFSAGGLAIGSILLLGAIYLGAYEWSRPFAWGALFIAALSPLVIASFDDTHADSVKANGMRMLGDATYSLYLTHSFVIGPVARLSSRVWADVPLAVYLIVCVIVSTLVAIATYRFVEKPLMKRLASAAPRRKVSHA